MYRPKPVYFVGANRLADTGFRVTFRATSGTEMPPSDEAPQFGQLGDAIRSHADWIARMPWTGFTPSEPELVEAAMIKWLDEYNEEFGDSPTRLLDSLDPRSCGDRILRLLKRPCSAFADSVESRQEIYQRVGSVLQQHLSQRPNATVGAHAVRDEYRSFGSDDGVRQCVMASSVEAQLEKAVAAFLVELEPIRARLANRYQNQASRDTIDEIVQDTSSDIVLKKIRTFKGESTLKRWVEQILSRAIIRNLKSKKKVSQYSIEALATEPSAVDSMPADGAGAEQTWERAWASLTDREAVVLRYVALGMQRQDIAKLFNVVPGTITRWINDATPKLKNHLEQNGESFESLLPIIEQLVASSQEEATQ